MGRVPDVGEARMSSRERRPSVFAFSSGAWPCGIANYHRHLAEQLSAQLSLETLLLPTERVSRSRPLTLWRYRRCYRRLAALADRADAVLLQLVSFWNGTRAGEHMLPAFWARLRRPVVTVLHEWPQPPEPEHYAGPAPVCWAKRLTTRAAGLFDYGAGGYDGWLASSFLGGTAHFIVHSKELRDRLADSGVDRTRLSWTPCPAFPLPAPRATGAETAARWTRGRRPIVLFGFPHPRKRYDVALQALARMGDEFVLVQVGSAEGAFRGACLQQLRRLAADLGVADRFVPTGEVDTQTMADLFHAAEIAWAPAEYATGSSSLGYLASAGLPIVATQPDSPQAAAYRAIAERVRDQLGAGGPAKAAPKIVIEA